MLMAKYPKNIDSGIKHLKRINVICIDSDVHFSVFLTPTLFSGSKGD